MALKVGELEAELLLEVVKFVRAAKKARNETKKTEKSFGKLGKVIKGVVGAVIVREAARMTVALVKAAADVEENFNLLGEVFGKQRDEIIKFADTLADEVGRSRVEVRKTIGTFQALLGPLTGNTEAASKMSTELAKLTIDLGSFFNVADVEALTALRSGITGELEPLKKFGIVMSQAALDAFALTQGLNKTVKQMTEAEKATLRFNFILAKTSAAQGDARRTAGSLSNQMRRLDGLVTDLQATLGQVIAPAALKFLEAVNTSASFWRDILATTKLSAAETSKLTDIERDIVKELEKRIRFLKLAVREGRNFSSDSTKVLGINLRMLSVDQRRALLLKQEAQLAAVLADAEKLGSERARLAAELKSQAANEAQRQADTARRLQEEERGVVRQAALLAAQMKVVTQNILRAADPTGRLSNEFINTRAKADDIVASIDGLGVTGPKTFTVLQNEAAVAQEKMDLIRVAAVGLQEALDAGQISTEIFAESVGKLDGAFNELQEPIVAFQNASAEAFAQSEADAEALKNKMLSIGLQIGGAFEASISALVEGTATVSQAFKGLVKDVVSAAISIAQALLIESIAAQAKFIFLTIPPPASFAVAGGVIAAVGGIFRGIIAGLQGGGQVKGVGTQDSKLAALAPGEVVVRAPLVQDLEALLGPAVGFGGGMAMAGGGGMGGGINLTVPVSTFLPLTNSEVDNFVTRRVIPSLRRAKARGAF